MSTTISYLLAYAAYMLGAAIYILDVIEKYRKIADASPNSAAIYSQRTFWYKEKYNVIRVALLGIISVLCIPWIISGTTIQAVNSKGVEIWEMSLKTAVIPMQIVLGYGGGRGIIAWLGKSKKELYEKAGLEVKEDS